MILLSKLNPDFIGVTRFMSGEGITFDCPACDPALKHRIAMHFENPIDGGPVAPWPEHRWKRVNDRMDNLTILGSVRYDCFHGWVENGRVFSVDEAPLIAVLMIDGKPQVTQLSPLQTMSLAKHSFGVANKLLES